MANWICPDCDTKTNFKGLCRECTEYDESGVAVKPIQRVRVNEDGSEYVKTVRRAEPMEMAQMRAKFIEQRQRQLTKKQKALAVEESKLVAAAQADIQAEAGEDGMLEIGENMSEEE
tara:strand:+ start:788 stop:1138 length:351 start_codon:yes stop_codon:yes gene_type:complete